MVPDKNKGNFFSRTMHIFPRKTQQKMRISKSADFVVKSLTLFLYILAAMPIGGFHPSGNLF